MSNKIAKKTAAHRRIVDSLFVMLRFSCTACSIADILPADHKVKISFVAIASKKKY